MSELRPECGTSTKPVTFDDTSALRRIYWAVRKRRSLAFGKLHVGNKSCAMGSFWDDNPGAIVHVKVTDMVAAVNDSVPPTATPSERRRHMMRWLEYKLGI